MNKLLSEELAANSSWRYLDSYSGPRLSEELLRNEFATLEEHSARVHQRVIRTLLHAYDSVAHYRRLWFRNRIRRRELAELPSLHILPVLKKSNLISDHDDLRSKKLLPGQSLRGQSRTSGTTGQPVRVIHSDISMAMFAWLKQRELRWFRHQPSGSHFSIRPGEEIAIAKDGSPWPNEKIFERKGWPYLDAIFETGPAFGFASTNSISEQLSVLNKLKPSYLLTEPATLENLAMQSIHPDTLSSLQGIQTVSQTLTQSMRDTASTVFGQKISQNYGLNEVGLVASMCEFGRYHVHEEHCFVEIVTDSDAHAKPGERGAIIVTALNNSALPLIRYDTEDSAEFCDRNCPCGRILKSFVAVEGRYRRLAHLPAGSYQRFKAIQKSVNDFARRNPDTIKRYQVCQLASGNFEVLLDHHELAIDRLNKLRESVTTAFNDAFPETQAPPIRLIQGNRFKGLEKRKFQIFYSELMPDDSLN